MGREAKRVPLDFDWPQHLVWFGYTFRPQNCLYCDAEGPCGFHESRRKACPVCDGNHFLFQEIEVPTGDGWQMWEDCTEGSPISPVFETPELLAHWLADTGASAFADMTATYDQWLQTVMRGWAPSAVCTPGKGFRSGVEDMAN